MSPADEHQQALGNAKARPLAAHVEPFGSRQDLPYLGDWLQTMRT